MSCKCFFAASAPTENILEKAWVIYAWLCNNENYTEAFAELCDYIGIKCVEVKGSAKGDKFRAYNRLVEDHTWYAIDLNNSTFLVDCKWGSRRRKSRKTKEFQPHYFLQPPQIFIYEHYSKDYQLQGKRIDFDRFVRMPRLRYTYFINALECTSHDLQTEFASANTEYTLEFTCRKAPIMDALFLSGTMTDANDTLMTNTFLIQKNIAKSLFKINVSLPVLTTQTDKDRHYTFNLFASLDDNKPEWCAQFYFDLSGVKASRVDSHKLCDTYSIETDVYLIKPLKLKLKLNEQYRFEVVLYDVLEVVLIELDKENIITPFEPVDRHRSQWYLAHRMNKLTEIIIGAKLTPNGPFISVFGYKVVE